MRGSSGVKGLGYRASFESSRPDRFRYQYQHVTAGVAVRPVIQIGWGPSAAG